MKRKNLVWLLALLAAVFVLLWSGVGPYASDSAVLDLKAELESIHGPEYTGKAVENGTEDMEFEVVPKTWLLTNWNLRNTLGLDYEYECRVVFTTHTADNKTILQTITYHAVDPMGKENMTERAHLILDTRTENN